ncbi:hypothetical protein OK016_27925 [Vibrio chagasii]|nr:hypothetical protein [Vibrio chagasii]
MKSSSANTTVKAFNTSHLLQMISTKTVKTLRDRGMDFMPTPDTYYEKVDERVKGHGEDTDLLRDLRVLD